jgi:acyl-CoA dehydrogenase
MIDIAEGMLAPSEASGELGRLAWQIGVDTAAEYADAVDQDARFPRETVDALRQAKLLSALVPESLGGGGARLAQVAGAVRALAFHCASSALILAMHSIEVSNLVRHGRSPALEAFLGEIAEQQLLLANANSEVGIGGDVGRSLCAVEPTEQGLRLEKEALAISYGEHADAVLATARRGPACEQTDQVQVLCRRPNLSLEQTSTWDAIGLRGTCSNGFRLCASFEPDMVYPVPFARIAAGGGIQASTILLSAAWVGLAEAAAAKAHAYVRAAARKSVGTMPPSASRLAELTVYLQQGRSLLGSAAAGFTALEESEEIESPAFIASVRNLKIGSSELAVKVATLALSICGIAGYKRDTQLSLDRHIRDAHGGLVMVSNDRYLIANAEMLLARKHL